MIGADITCQEVYESLTSEQKNAVHLLIGLSLTNETGYLYKRPREKALKVYENLLPVQRSVVDYLMLMAVKQRDAGT